MLRRWERLRHWWRQTCCGHQEWLSLRFTRDGKYVEQRCRRCGLERNVLRGILKVKGK